MKVEGQHAGADGPCFDRRVQPISITKFPEAMEEAVATRGEVDIKGKGVMRTWYLVGRRDDDVRAAIETG